MRNKGLKSIFALLLTALLAVSLSAAAFAVESAVTFENNQAVVFEPGSSYTGTDLFDSFKGAMPGDTLKEEITVKNDVSQCDYIKVYLRAVLHDEAGNPISKNVLDELRADSRRGETTELAYMHDFLSKLSMTVKNDGAEIYKASPDELDGLAENVYLGTIRRNQTLTLDVELSVPIELDNRYANRIGEVDWIFAAEGFDDTTPSPPPTTDYTRLTVRKLWDDDGENRPGSITVNLLRNGNQYDQVELNPDNQWVHTWSRLNDRYTWSVEEESVPAGYSASYSTEGTTTTITNKKAGTTPTVPGDPPPSPPSPPGPVDITVVKAWEDNGKNRPDSVKATLYNGETAVETVWLGKGNNWTYQWKNLDGSGNWQVLETEIPKGYTPSYRASGGVITITNTAYLLQTGQLNWPIPVLGGLGLLLTGYGIVTLIRRRKNNA